jgi:DNA-binding response OmpR family regulator
MMSTILLIEDDPLLCQLIGEILTFSEYQVLTATDGRAALELLQASNALPDVILSDLLMPPSSIIELFAAVRSQRQWTEIPFMILSSKAQLIAFGLEFPYEVDGYIAKPFAIKDLLTSVQQALAMSRDNDHDQQSSTGTVRLA